MYPLHSLLILLIYLSRVAQSFMRAPFLGQVRRAETDKDLKFLKQLTGYGTFLPQIKEDLANWNVQTQTAYILLTLIHQAEGPRTLPIRITSMHVPI